MISRILLIVAIVFLALFTVYAYDWFTTEHPFGFLGAGLFFYLVSLLPWDAWIGGRRSEA